MKAEIKYLKFKYMLGRSIGFCQLKSGDEVLLDGTLLACVKHADENDIEITNAQEVLNVLILNNAFAS
jgi:preprotein translocase subunit YajC